NGVQEEAARKEVGALQKTDTPDKGCNGANHHNADLEFPGYLRKARGLFDWLKYRYFYFLTSGAMTRKLSNQELGRLSKEQYLTAQKNAVVVVLDNVRSLHNVGSAFRTADAFRIEMICLCGVTGTPPHREIEKTALGATDTV